MLEEGKEMVEAIIDTVQKQTGRIVDNIRVGENRPNVNYLEALIVFTDGKRLDSRITITKVKNQLACRIQGNYF